MYLFAFDGVKKHNRASVSMSISAPTASKDIQRRDMTTRYSLLAPADSPLVVVFEARGVDDFDALAEADHVGAFPPLGYVVLGGLGSARGCLVVGVDEAAQPGAVAADDDDGLADPALEVGNVPAVGAAEGVDDVDEVRGQVAQHVDEARGGAEG